MLTWIREKFGTVLIGLIIGFIAFVFVFYGVITPKATRGLHEGAVAGKVNGEPIQIAEFERSLRQRLEFMKSMFPNNAQSEQMLQDPRIKQAVFGDLVRKKIMVQEADRQGMTPADEEIRERIRTLPYFQENGAFSVVKYREVLAANGYSPDTFERLLRQDLAAEQWNDYFKARVQVSEPELKEEFGQTQDRRNIKYVLLSTEVGRKGVQVSAEEAKKYLSDEAHKNLVKSQYEREKETQYKGKTLEQAQDAIARDLIAGGKLDEIKKVNEKLAGEIQPILTADKASDARVNAILKAYGTQVKSTGLVSRLANYLPGIGEAKDLMTDAFAAPKSPIDPAQGGKAKKYESASWLLVAVVTESQRPDYSKFESERPKLQRAVAQKKERALFDAFMQSLVQKADIEPNEAVLGKES